jgi:hypothetical protein
MTVKKPQVIVDPDIHVILKSNAKKRNISLTALIKDLVEKQLPLSGEKVDTVILKIPKATTKDSQNLRTWLNLRVEAIVQALSKK